ncbi:MAG: hypothetical protein ACRDTM_14110 [Micromonosporaceae bacterium]
MSRGFMLKLTAVLVGLMLVPAAAATAATEVPETTPQDTCGSVASELQTKLEEIKSALTTESVDRPVVADLVKEAEGTAAGAQKEECLPPITLEENLAPCEAATEDLLGGLLGTLGAVIAGTLKTALDLVNGLLSTLTGLLGGGCLPEPPVDPPVPGVPAK